MALLYCLPFDKPITSINVQMGAMIAFLSIVSFLFQLNRLENLFIKMLLTFNRLFDTMIHNKIGLDPYKLV